MFWNVPRAVLPEGEPGPKGEIMPGDVLGGVGRGKRGREDGGVGQEERLGGHVKKDNKVEKCKEEEKKG